MFTLNYMTAEEIEAVNPNYLKYPLIRPSHRVANIMEPNNVLTVCPTVDWMQKRKNIQSGSGYRRIGVPVPASTADRFFPDKIVNACWKFTDGLVAFVDNEIFIIGDRYYNSYGFSKSRDESYEVLGKVESGGEFAPLIVPNYGLVLRAMTKYDYRVCSGGSTNKASFNSFDFEGNDRLDEDGPIPIQHIWSIYLVKEEGTPHPTDFIEGYKEVMDKMDLNPPEGQSLGKLLQHWDYPMDMEDNCEIPLSDGRFRMLAGTQYKAYRGWEMEYVEGSGKVTMSHVRDGETSVLSCYPGLEHPFIKSFK